MKKKVLAGIILVLVAIFLLGITKDIIIKSVITIVASKVTGAPVHIDSFSMGIFNQTVKISGLKIYNPQGFSRGILINVATANVTYDLGALLKKKIHLAKVEFDLKEMDLEKNKGGKLNVDSLKVAKREDGGKGKETGKPAKQLPLSIDMFRLDMGKLIYKDFSLGKEPSVQVYDINIHKVYKNITSAQQLAALIMSEPMKAAGIQGAKIYGAAILTGVAVLPVAAVLTFAGKDSVKQEFNSGLDAVYKVSLAILKQMGNVNKEDKAGMVISAKVNSADVTIKLRKISNNKTEVTISARKYFIPKPEIAGGVLYKISEKIK